MLMSNQWTEKRSVILAKNTLVYNTILPLQHRCSVAYHGQEEAIGIDSRSLEVGMA